MSGYEILVAKKKDKKLKKDESFVKLAVLVRFPCENF